MTIYVDSNFRCFAEPNENRKAFEVPFFDGKCKTFVEGYRFVPAGESWTRDDGKVFEGEMFSPWRPWKELDAAQREYEREEAEDMRQALSLLGVTVK